MFTQTDLINHLETLIEKIQNKELDDDKLQDISLMYVKHTFDKQIKMADMPSDKLAMEYMSLGWYIHTFLMKDKGQVNINM